MAKRDPESLTFRQGKFVSEFLKDRNALQAAIRAGYSPKSANNAAHDNMRHPGILAKIEESLNARQADNGVSPDFVLRELKRVAEQEDVAQSTKVRALELIAKHLGMLEDRISLKTDGLSGEQRAERVAILLERVAKR